MKKRAEWGKTIIGRSLSVPGGQDYNKLHTGIYYILYSLPPPPRCWYHRYGTGTWFRRVRVAIGSPPGGGSVVQVRGVPIDQRDHDEQCYCQQFVAMPEPSLPLRCQNKVSCGILMLDFM